MLKNWFDDASDNKLKLYDIFSVKSADHWSSDWYEKDCINKINICSVLL